MIKKLLTTLRQYAKEGLFHIFGSSVIAQVGGLISSMVVIRFLEKVQYGNYVSAYNAYSYPAIFVGLGMTNVVMQYCSENVTEQRKSAIFRHAFWAGNRANLLVAIVTAGLALWKLYTGQPMVALYLLLMCGLPFINYADSYFQSVLRVKQKNQVFSYANIAYSVVLLSGNIILTRLFDIPGLIYSKYLAFLTSSGICAVVLYRNRFFAGFKDPAAKLERAEKKSINSYAYICAITNFTSIVLTLLDVTCLDLVLGDATVLADYNVAATIPSACTFVPSCLMMFFYPKLVSAVSNGKQEGRSYIFQLAKVYAVVNGLVYLCLALFAPLIIWIIYGQKYMNVVGLFEILSLNYLAYCVRNLMGNVIAAVKKVKVNLVFSVVSGVLNICLNLLLIPWLGAMGAAVATLIVTITVAVLDCTYVLHHFKREK